MFVVKNKKKTIAEVHFLTDKKEIKNKMVNKIIKETLLKCYEEIPLTNKKVAIFYSKDEFIKNKMNGIAGSALLHENVITISINPVKNWKKDLSKTIAHEYSHLAVLDVRSWDTLLDSLIIEGIAENFIEELLHKNKFPWTTVLTEKESKTLLKKLKSKLNKKSGDMHTELFFGSKDYKMWSGYSLGYYIVKNFRKQNPNLRWKEIIKLSSREILNKSKFLK